MGRCVFLPIKDGSLSKIACIVIAGGKRRQLLDQKILPSIPQTFDDILVVGEHHAGDGYSYLHVPDMLRTTTDALIKRDVGSLATNADILCYLSDDHGMHWDFLTQLRAIESGPWDAIMPARYCTVAGEEIPLNMGQSPALPSVAHPGQAIIVAGQYWRNGVTVDYLGGHAGVFRRSVIQARPWTTMPHDRVWDVLASKEQMRAGARFVFAPNIKVEDFEIEGKPWQ